MRSQGGPQARETDARVDVWFLGLVPSDGEAELGIFGGWRQTVAVTGHCKALPISFRM